MFTESVVTTFNTSSLIQFCNSEHVSNQLQPNSTQPGYFELQLTSTYSKAAQFTVLKRNVWKIRRL